MNSLPWILLLVPLLSAALILVALGRFKNLSAAVSVAACAISFGAACAIFAGGDAVRAASFTWIDTAGFQVAFGITLDELSRVMLLVVTFVGLLIHIYSLGYMKSDDGKSRYFAGLSLFMFSMLGIVVADNFVMMFVFWELVGVSSYLLIGHWFERPAAADAAKKAFITNRIGDFGFMLGILMLWWATGSFAFKGVESALAAQTFEPWFLTAAALLVFCGAVGKSAQFPLHVWLPDAMEGPTPVSALIHAATMVAAGVYMLVRVFFLVEASPAAQNVIAIIGITTALLAALMATQQNDIKRILAYSTLSQLGYMVMAVGVAAASAAMFHLMTHAFFKALLFLGAGSVIHAMHHEQDIWKMGGLKNKLPVTFLTFAVGTAALIGVPGLSGFFSKEAVLGAAFARNPVFFWLGIVTAALTAFYMTRLFLVAFLGTPKSSHAKNAGESPGVMTLPLVLLAIPSAIAGYGFFAGRFYHVAHHEPAQTVLAGSLGALALGVLAAFALYRKAEKDPVLIPLFANKFYFDEIYDWIIRRIQGTAAALAGWFDRWVLDGLIVRGLGGLAWGAGYVLRFLQVGNLQAYAFLLGVGLVALLYFVIFQGL